MTTPASTMTELPASTLPWYDSEYADVPGWAVDIDSNDIIPGPAMAAAMLETLRLNGPSNPTWEYKLASKCTIL